MKNLCMREINTEIADTASKGRWVEMRKPPRIYKLKLKDPKPEPETRPKPVSDKKIIFLREEIGYREGKIIRRPLYFHYLDARKKAIEAGGQLISNITYDYCMNNNQLEEWEILTWIREILVYPESYGTFRQGKDVVDQWSGWVLPASELLKANQIKEIFGIGGVGLFIDPEDIVEDKGRMIVIPRTIVVVYDLPQRSGFKTGAVDKATKIPLEEDYSEEDYLDTIFGWRLKRFFARSQGAGVTPLIRWISWKYDSYAKCFTHRNTIFISTADPYSIARAVIEKASEAGDTEEVSFQSASKQGSDAK